MAEILVIGSSNTDMVVQAPYLPTAGETVLGNKFVMSPGGKGANQAVAAARLGGKVSFLGKLAPACPLTDCLLSQVTILTPNQTEAKILTGIEVDSPSTAGLAAQQLHNRGVANVIITLGKEGAYLFNEQVAQLIPSYTVEAVDTTAAGDTFNGALAVALSEGQEMVEAVKFANLTAAVSVTRLGAQSSLPLRQEVEPSKLP